MLNSARAIPASTLRAAARAVGKALRNGQDAWRHHVFSHRFRSEIAEVHERCCAGYIPPAEAAAKARRFLASNFGGYSDLRWHELYWCVTGMVDSAYIPDDLFDLRIEPALNAMSYVGVLTDKNGCYNLPVAPHLPEPVLHLVRGVPYRPGFLPIREDEIAGLLGSSSEKFIVKPATEHGGGRSLQLLDGPAATALLAEVLCDRHARSAANWLVQRRLEQCAELAHFNMSSVNCYRVMTLRMDNGATRIASYFRTGGSAMPVDNFQSGGLACGIEGGRLKGWGIDRRCRIHKTHPASGAPISGELPVYDEAVALCCKLHGSLPWFDLVSWDVAIDARYQPRIIEFNAQAQGIQSMQFTNGPLFGPEGSAALAYVLRKLTSAKQQAEHG